MNLLIIKEIARKKNISLVELAKRIGMTNPALHKMISENSTKVDTLEKIAEVLEVPITFFFQELSSQDLSLSDQLNELKQKLRKKEEEFERLSKEFELNKENYQKINDKDAEIIASLKENVNEKEFMEKVLISLFYEDWQSILSQDRKKECDKFIERAVEKGFIKNGEGLPILMIDNDYLNTEFNGLSNPFELRGFNERIMFYNTLLKKNPSPFFHHKN